MGRFIPHNSEVGRVFNAVHSMFQGLVNLPIVDRYGKPTPDEFDKGDLHIANELLNTLEHLYPLKLGNVMNPAQCGFSTEEMAREYAQIKHWQRLLNNMYGEKAP